MRREALLGALISLTLVYDLPVFWNTTPMVNYLDATPLPLDVGFSLHDARVGAGEQRNLVFLPPGCTYSRRAA
jgi:hypothetical protein